MPLVPIVPNMIKEMHHQWQAYGGFSFAFQDYLDAGIINYLDTPLGRDGFAMIDPLNY
jgi:PhoPQ-activated pathogenicity-related protein